MPAPDEQGTSAIEARLREDLKEATRARDQVRMDTLRLGLNAIHTEEVARTDPKHPLHGQPMTEADRIAALDKQIKQRQESAQIYRANNRPELADKEEREAQILSAYLPTKMTDNEIRQVVSDLITQHGKDFRTIMPLASRETKGRADGRRVQEIVREMTN
jgi:uncharacterized protein YqeY